MTRQKRVIVAVGGLLGTVVLLCLLLRFWPFFALSLLQQGMQTKMHCWVKVVDQDNKVVKGYKCRVDEEHASWLPFSKGKDIVRIFETGDDGYFEFQSKGRTGRVFFGYSWGLHWTMNPKHLIQRRDLAVTSSAYQRGVSENPTGYLGSWGNPYLLHVFTVGPPQKLLFWKKCVNIEKEGNYACIDLLAGRIWESKSPEGDVAIADGLFGKNRVLPECFHYVVGSANCGIAPVLDDWGLCPPENGYKHELCTPRDWEARNWSSNGVQIYYRLISAKTGKVAYGRLTLGMSPRVQNAEIQTYTNLQGERNLYYDGYNEDPSGFYHGPRDFVSQPVQ